MFSTNFDRYIEVFGGEGRILFDESPDQKYMEMYNDCNSNLADLFYCVESQIVTFLQELGFFPLNSRGEFTAIRDFIDRQAFDINSLRKGL